VKKLDKVCILGAGTMGRGIAQWMAQAGVQVELADTQKEISEGAKQLVIKSWNKLIEKGKFTSSEVEMFTENFQVVLLEDYDKEADLFLEVIIENGDIKKSVFSKLDNHFNAQTVFASNTSSIPIDSLVCSLSPDRKKHFLGLHFFNPAPIMKLVEVIKGHETSSSLVDFFKEWFTQKGKKPAVCQDSPGFIVNRIARNFYGEALRIVGHEDHQKIAQLDTTMREVGGFKMGPFELMDLIGIDVNYSVTQSVWESYYFENRFAPHALQRKMVESGRIGKKVKKGFYQYE
jgi:3-hydroxybutyryl-CoA dehydrogenase